MKLCSLLSEIEGSGVEGVLEAADGGLRVVVDGDCLIENAGQIGVPARVFTPGTWGGVLAAVAPHSP